MQLFKKADKADRPQPPAPAHSRTPGRPFGLL